MEDIRDYIFRDLSDVHYTCKLRVQRNGIISGITEALQLLERLGIKVEYIVPENSSVKDGDVIVIFHATPQQVGKAEELLIGCLAKYSGIATASHHAVTLAAGSFEIVSGAWKKMPGVMKDGIRKAVVAGGAQSRVASHPMIYLDKNAVRMFGSVSKALDSVKDLTDHKKVVQIRGESTSIEEETSQALHHGAGVLMVDTGNTEDLKICISTVYAMECRDRVKIAFAGDNKIERIEEFKNYDIDIFCIGKEIVDADLLDMRLDVIERR